MSMFIGHKPKKQQLTALSRCRLPENQALLDLFEAKLNEVKDSLLVANDQVTMYRLQGKASVLKEFLEAVKESQEVLGRL
jgi:hypothetical protein